MTEDEAKTKVCCGPLHQPEYAKIGEIAESKPSIRNCIGSACMAWRWEDVRWVRPENNAGTREYELVPRSNLGFCGLAGRQ